MSRHLPFVALLLIAGTLVCLGQGTPPAASPPPTRLAVVNIVDLFNRLLEKTAADQDIEKMKKDFEDQSRAQQDDLEKRQRELDNPTLFKRGSPEYLALQEEQLKKSMELQAFGSYAQNKLFLEQRLRTAGLYRKMNDAIKEYSQANGIALVFVADEMNIDSARTQEQLTAIATMRKVVYFHADFDITPAIIQKMNTAYQMGGQPRP